MVRDETEDTVSESDDARPVWEVLQAIDWALYDPATCAGNTNCHTPNATEVRSMHWQAFTYNCLYYLPNTQCYRDVVHALQYVNV
jgi:hypothetical protein